MINAFSPNAPFLFDVFRGQRKGALGANDWMYHGGGVFSNAILKTCESQSSYLLHSSADSKDQRIVRKLVT